MRLRTIHSLVAAAGFAAALSSSLTATSCAKATEDNMLSVEQQAFEEWVAKYVTGRGVQAVRQDNGMYVEFLADGPQDDGAVSAVGKDVWVRLEYTGTDIEGNVFITCSEAEARQQGSFTPHTHYTPDYLSAGSENSNMVAGQYYSLKNKLRKADGTEVKLTKGSKVKLYMPSYLAMGSGGASDDQGYGGQWSLDGTSIVIEEMEVVDVVEDPEEREKTLVNAHALTWGKAETDTIKTLIFLDENFSQKPELLLEWPDKQEPTPGAYGLTADSTARVRYIGKFLDGFIFDTNIQSVYDEFYGRDPKYPAEEKTCDVTYYKPASQKDSFIEAFYHAIPKMKRGRWYRVLFPSKYAYGSTGMSAGTIEANGGTRQLTTEIQPYTPLIFEVYIETEETE